MRRKDREVTDCKRIKEIIMSCDCLRLGLNDNGKVYIVPLSFGYEETDGKRIFYFHCAGEGRKTDIIKSDNAVGFELDCDYAVKEAPSACGYTARYSSVIGTGKVYFVDYTSEKVYALLSIMRHYTSQSDWKFDKKSVEKVTVLRLEVDELSCKAHE